MLACFHSLTKITETETAVPRFFLLFADMRSKTWTNISPWWCGNFSYSAVKRIVYTTSYRRWKLAKLHCSISEHFQSTYLFCLRVISRITFQRSLNFCLKLRVVVDNKNDSRTDFFILNTLYLFHAWQRIKYISCTRWWGFTYPRGYIHSSFSNAAIFDEPQQQILLFTSSYDGKFDSVYNVV